MCYLLIERLTGKDVFDLIVTTIWSQFKECYQFKSGNPKVLRHRPQRFYYSR